MIVLIVVITVVVFIVVDLALRLYMRRIQEAKIKKERETALDIGLRLDLTDEAKSLKRVEVENPKAKILAVDDEKIILDSFRKILVLAGYSIDTVEKGAEALGLIQKHNYDFIFTDLKMPEMDGVEVTKAVKHLRPDIDVIVITGYASIETAVETMKFGAMDYVQKPFTEDELISFINKSLIKRQDRIEKHMKPTIRLITPFTMESTSKNEFNIPAGIFVAQNHTWVTIEMNGTARVGIDDFIRKSLGKFDNVELPNLGKHIKRGEILFSLTHNTQTFQVSSPISGKVTLINTEHIEHPEWMVIKPFELSWMCCIQPANLSEELQSLRIGMDTVQWYQMEINKFNEIVKNTEKMKQQSDSVVDSRNEPATGFFDEKIREEFSKLLLHK